MLECSTPNLNAGRLSPPSSQERHAAVAQLSGDTMKEYSANEHRETHLRLAAPFSLQVLPRSAAELLKTEADCASHS